jgi:hypothetical protein
MAKHTRENQDRHPRDCHIGQLVISLGGIKKKIEETQQKLDLLGHAHDVKDSRELKKRYRKTIKELEGRRDVCRRWLEIRRAEESSTIDHVMSRYGE